MTVSPAAASATLAIVIKSTDDTNVVHRAVAPAPSKKARFARPTPARWSERAMT